MRYGYRQEKQFLSIKNVVHMVSRLGDCHYNSFIFPAYFLEFYPGSPAKIFVENITANEQLSVFRFSSLVDWHKDMTVILQQLVEIERNKTAFYASACRKSPAKAGLFHMY